jgi:3-phosphoshikimate 1-carboxyvinyltransferase
MRLVGEVTVPGDKSVSHRALLFNTLAPGGVARIRGLSHGEDVRATQVACEQLGARVQQEGDELVLRAPDALQTPASALDCGNSGTSIRLLLGALAGRPVEATLTGDESLQGRPMGRLVRPLRQMGAQIGGPSDGERAPLWVKGGALRQVAHDLPVASAQLKSGLLLAGLGCGVSVREPAQSRDHTERMLRAMGASLHSEDRHTEDGWLSLSPSVLSPLDVDVPGDLSSAAFLLVAAALLPGSELVIRQVGLNPTRTGVLDVLRAMGADLRTENLRQCGEEPMADLVIRHGPLRGVDISGELTVRSLDELVVLSVAAAFAEGTTTISDAAELRVKESDRLARVASGLRALGVELEERPDGLVITGGRPSSPPGGPAVVDATGDHRVAMAFTVAGLVAPGGVTVQGADSVSSSWPGFFGTIDLLRRS